MVPCIDNMMIDQGLERHGEFQGNHHDDGDRENDAERSSTAIGTASHDEHLLQTGQTPQEHHQQQQPCTEEQGNIEVVKKHVPVWRKAKKFCWDYHLPLILVLALIIGIAWPLPGKVLGDTKLNNGLCLIPAITNVTADSGEVSQIKEPVCVWTSLSSLCVTLIFFISGLQLKLAKVKEAVSMRKEVAMGLFLIIILTTSFGYAVAGASSKLQPVEFSFGLALFNIMPTTLSSCVVITTAARGHTALALLLSVSTNLIGVIILPLTLSWMVTLFYAGSPQSSADSTGAAVDIASLSLSLVFTVLIPLFIGIFLRTLFISFSRAVDRHNSHLKLLSAILLTAIPWMKVSQSAANFAMVSAVDYILLVISVIGMHLLFLMLCAFFSMWVINVPLASQKALVIVGCQKTLPVALSVLESLPSTVSGRPGLVSVAIIIAHLFQTLFDSFLAAKWQKWTMDKEVDVK